jgi:hypothetical protein
MSLADLPKRLRMMRLKAERLRPTSCASFLGAGDGPGSATVAKVLVKYGVVHAPVGVTVDLPGFLRWFHRPPE